VHGVPDFTGLPAPPNGRLPRRRPVAVLFDFVGTLAQVEDAIEWVQHAARACGVELERLRATVLADRLLTAGRPGGPPPHRVPPHLAEVWADRDLYPHAHRAAYTGLARTVDCGVAGLPDALYERLLTAEGWWLYPDAPPTLSALQAAGVPVGVVSNVGFDLRPIAADLGLADLVDDWVLSYEVGRGKPDPAIFLRACATLGAEPERVLVVGTTPADAAASELGCTALTLPPGDSLGAVLDLIGCEPVHT
jgi:HAD superfamily hydrolase (TIGR01509 family)